MKYKRIVAFGGSNCEGKVDPDWGGFIGRLRQWYETFDSHHHVFNLGISGNTTRDLLGRFTAESQVRKPSLVLFQFGINDTARIGRANAPSIVPIEEYETNIKELVNQAKKMAEKIIIVGAIPNIESTTTPVSWVDWYYFSADALAYNEVIKKVADETGCMYIDVIGAWGSDYAQYLYEDGLHAGTKGHESIFQMIKAALQNIENES